MALSMEPILPTKIVPRRGNARQEGGRDGWRRRSESNRCIEVLQTSALPLGYAANPGCFGGARFYRARRRGVNAQAGTAANGGHEKGRLPREPAWMMERETGVEPATSTLA